MTTYYFAAHFYGKIIIGMIANKGLIYSYLPYAYETIWITDKAKNVERHKLIKIQVGEW